MRYYLLTIFFVLLTFAILPSSAQTFPLSKTSPSFNQVPPELTPIVEKLLKLPEARVLLMQASREGSVGIVMQNDPSGQFDALWDGDARLIRLNPYRHPNQGSWICSILFELHNAGTNKHMLTLFRSAENNHVSKEMWVEQMERMEHANALNTCRLLEKGISQGIYPHEATWVIFYEFDDYYKLQQISGHSHWLANKFDQTNPYSTRAQFQGTISGLNSMTVADKKDLETLLVLKNDLKSPNQQEFLKSNARLKAEYARLDECALGKSRSGCFRTQEKIKLMNVVFGPGRSSLHSPL